MGVVRFSLKVKGQVVAYPSLPVSCRQVRFSEAVVVHPLVDWAVASQAARDGGCWMEMARDRHRFRRRVQQASDIISPLLQANHRARVWERFQLN